MRFEELTGDAGERDLGGGVTLRYRQVPHLPPTFALRVEAGGGAVCFGADCADNDELPALAEGADVLVCECSFGAGEVPRGVPHLNGAQAGRDRRAGRRAAAAPDPLLPRARPRRGARGGAAASSPGRWRGRSRARRSAA